MKKRKKIIILFVLSIGFFSLNFAPKMTGNIIGTLFNFLNIPTIFGFLFLIGSFITSLSEKNLDVIIIPTGPSLEEDKERTIRAIEEHKKEETKYFLISGEKGNPKLSKNILFLLFCVLQ